MPAANQINLRAEVMKRQQMLCTHAKWNRRSHFSHGTNNILARSDVRGTSIWFHECRCAPSITSLSDWEAKREAAFQSLCYNSDVEAIERFNFRSLIEKVEPLITSHAGTQSAFDSRSEDDLTCEVDRAPPAQIRLREWTVIKIHNSHNFPSPRTAKSLASADETRFEMLLSLERNLKKNISWSNRFNKRVE